MKTYIPNERIVDRAVELWVQMLRNPKYDNLGKDSPEPLESRVQCTMASALTSMLPKNNTPDVLQRFGQELKTILMGPTEYTASNGEKYKTMFQYMSVDYHPDIPLSEAAKRAGLKMEFPWKTHMWLSDNYLSVACGYGAPSVYHYPLTNDRWLVTTLSGEDMPKIIALVESGTLTLDLTVNKS